MCSLGNLRRKNRLWVSAWHILWAGALPIPRVWTPSSPSSWTTMGNLVNIGKIIPAIASVMASKRWNYKHVLEMMKTFSVLSFSYISSKHMVWGPLKDISLTSKGEILLNYFLALGVLFRDIWGFSLGVEALPALGHEYRSGACMDSSLTAPVVRAEQAALEDPLWRMELQKGTSQWTK